MSTAMKFLEDYPQHCPLQTVLFIYELNALLVVSFQSKFCELYCS